MKKNALVQPQYAYKSFGGRKMFLYNQHLTRKTKKDVQPENALSFYSLQNKENIF